MLMDKLLVNPVAMRVIDGGLKPVSGKLTLYL